jgi:hypothetical protein
LVGAAKIYSALHLLYSPPDLAPAVACIAFLSVCPFKPVAVASRVHINGFRQRRALRASFYLVSENRTSQ